MHSMISYWCHDVICPSVSSAVWWHSGSVLRAKSCTIMFVYNVSLSYRVHQITNWQTPKCLSDRRIGLLIVSQKCVAHSAASVL